MIENKMFLGVAFGPMGGGKSSYLVDKYRAYSQSSRVLVITHEFDTRGNDCGVTTLCTHDGKKVPATARKTLLDLDITEVDVVLIDEGQFFPDLLEFVQYHFRSDLTVFVAGLDGDAEQKKFGQVVDILPYASEKVAKYNICSVCQSPAAFTVRRLSDMLTSQIDPGGFDKYATVCHKHLFSSSLK